MFETAKDRFDSLQRRLGKMIPGGWVLRMMGILLALYLFGAVLLGIYWSLSPSTFDVRERAALYATQDGADLVTGSITTGALLGVTQTTLGTGNSTMQIVSASL